MYKTFFLCLFNKLYKYTLYIILYKYTIYSILYKYTVYSMLYSILFSVCTHFTSVRALTIYCLRVQCSLMQ